jgi:hypothetical protein
VSEWFLTRCGHSLIRPFIPHSSPAVSRQQLACNKVMPFDDYPSPALNLPFTPLLKQVQANYHDSAERRKVDKVVVTATARTDTYI